METYPDGRRDYRHFVTAYQQAVSSSIVRILKYLDAHPKLSERKHGGHCATVGPAL